MRTLIFEATNYLVLSVIEVILKALEAAHIAGCTSLALNSISTGIFGGPLDTCSVIIVNAIREYFAAAPWSVIKKVSLTNKDDQTVNAAEQALLIAMGEIDVDDFKISIAVRSFLIIMAISPLISFHHPRHE